MPEGDEAAAQTPTPPADLGAAEVQEEATPKEPTLGDVMKLLENVQGESRAASGRATKATELSASVAQQLQTLQYGQAQSSKGAEARLEALAAAMLEDDQPTPDAEERRPSRKERFQQELDSRLAPPKAEENSAQQPDLATAIQEHELRRDAQKHMDEAVDYLADIGLKPSAFRAAQKGDPDTWLERGSTLDEMSTDFRRKADAFKAQQGKEDKAPPGTPDRPGATGGGGFHTFDELETAFSNGDISLVQLKKGAEKFPEGQRLLEIVAKR
jgi:hypothetical protein